MICKDRVVIITGAGGGLGKAHAMAFAAAGARVVVNDYGASLGGEGSSEAPAEQVARAIREAGGEAVAHFGDVSDWSVGAQLVELALDTWGGLDVVVNNAGIVRDQMFFNSEQEAWEDTLRVHVMGHVATTRHAAEYWRRKSKAGEQVDGRILNTTSGAGLQGSVGQAAYSAAKGAIASLTLVQAAELGRYGVTANAIAPVARTRMTETVFAAMMAKPEEGFDAMDPANVSPLLVWLGSEQGRDVTGRVFEVQGGHVALSDGWRPLTGRDNGARWESEQLGSVVAELISEAPKPAGVYGG